jgi:hypothetical protein
MMGTQITSPKVGEGGSRRIVDPKHVLFLMQAVRFDHQLAFFFCVVTGAPPYTLNHVMM